MSGGLEKIRIEQFRKGTPLAPVIWERDEIKKSIDKPEELNDADWMSKLTKQVGKIAHEIEEKETNEFDIEDEIIKAAALCLVWISAKRQKRKSKTTSSSAKEGSTKLTE